MFFSTQAISVESRADCLKKEDWEWAQSQFQFEKFAPIDLCDPSNQLHKLLSSLIYLREWKLTDSPLLSDQMLRIRMGDTPFAFFKQFVSVFRYESDIQECEQRGFAASAIAYVRFETGSERVVHLCEYLFTTKRMIPSVLLHEAEHLRTRTPHVRGEGDEQLARDKTFRELGPYAISYLAALSMLGGPNLDSQIRVNLRRQALSIAKSNFVEPPQVNFVYGAIARTQSGAVYFLNEREVIRLRESRGSKNSTLFIDIDQVSGRTSGGLEKPFFGKESEDRERVASKWLSPEVFQGIAQFRMKTAFRFDRVQGYQAELYCQSVQSKWGPPLKIVQVSAVGFQGIGPERLLTARTESGWSTYQCADGQPVSNFADFNLSLNRAKFFVAISPNEYLAVDSQGIPFFVRPTGGSVYNPERVYSVQDLEKKFPLTVDWKKDPIQSFLPWTWYQPIDEYFFRNPSTEQF